MSERDEEDSDEEDDSEESEGGDDGDQRGRPSRKPDQKAQKVVHHRMKSNQCSETEEDYNSDLDQTMQNKYMK